MAVLTTGILLRDPASFNANVVVANLSPTNSQKVTVEVFDWGVEQLWNKPKPIPVGAPAGPATIGPHTQQAFLALITQSTAQPGLALSLYEIRITLASKVDLVVNCFAINTAGGIIAANTVLHSGLFEMS